MGTRTVIRFVKKNYTSKKQLYIHWDGHLHFVGKKLFEMMQEYNKNKSDFSTDDIINMCKSFSTDDIINMCKIFHLKFRGSDA